MAAQQSSTGTVGRVTEITARSGNSFEDAVQVGIERATSTLRHVETRRTRPVLLNHEEPRDP